MREMLLQIWTVHKGKIAGSSVGFIFGCLVIFLGFFKALFIAICALLGYFIGKRIDEKEDIIEILERFLPPGYR